SRHAPLRWGTLVTVLWFFHVGRRFAEGRHFGYPGENVSRVSESVTAPAVPQWKFIHALSAKNDIGSGSSTDACAPKSSARAGGAGALAARFRKLAGARGARAERRSQQRPARGA